MQKLPVVTLAVASLALGVTALHAAAIVGQPAPALTASDADGKSRSLDEFKGKLVVLEWWNPGCPFVGKHYGSGNMQTLQHDWTAKGVVWLTVDSSAPGQQGYLTAAEAKATMKERGGAPTAVLLDPQGTTGKAFGAKTTPHMFVIDKTGVVAYAGGIDDKPSTDREDIPTAHNSVASALGELLAGKAVSVKSTPSYGCSVKYAH